MDAKHEFLMVILTLIIGVSVCGDDFYDEATLYTLELQFEQTDWWAQLEANYNAQENILATLTMDGVTYEDVGVRFRGNTSYRRIGDSQKKSFNIEIDYTHEDQDLMGYETLNLINCMDDPTFMREVLYSNTCRQQVPSAKANFVKLTINGENWGIYANIQQLNGEFIRDWFPSNDGSRWRAQGSGGGGGTRPPGGRRNAPAEGDITTMEGGGGVSSGVAALTWQGNDPNTYAAVYELKNTKLDDPWAGLMQACDVLNNTPLDELPAVLDPVLNVDRALWLCAFEIIFHDDDGYVHKRGSDYGLYYEPEHNRLHLMQYDGNSCMRNANNNWSLFYREDDAVVPLMNRLLALPQYRQRYLAHVRTILESYLTEENLYPTIDAYQALIEAEVELDDKKLESTTAFINGVPTLKQFIQTRRTNLLAHEEVDVPTPMISSVKTETTQVGDDQALSVTVTVENNVPVALVQLYIADTTYGPFQSQVMESVSDTDYKLNTDAYPPGTTLRYYIEVVAADSVGTRTFSPPGAEHDVYTATTSYPAALSSAVIINELMAKNDAALADPQGDYDDWLELYNISSNVVDLTGMYLSDNPENPLKWQFPDNTTLNPGAYLIVWADEDGEDEDGLHTNFKLSADGETVRLYDSDERDNLILDSVTFTALETDQSFGRLPNGSGDFQILDAPSPGQANDGL